MLKLPLRVRVQKTRSSPKQWQHAQDGIPWVE
jgi:hypothetical protein